jgi:hypothetical protein
MRVSRQLLLALLGPVFIGVTDAHVSLAQASGTGRRPDARRAGAFVGCYRLTNGPWSKNSLSRPAYPPEILRLDSTAARNDQPGWRAATRVAPAELLSTVDPRSHWLQPSSWRIVGADSVEIVTWTTATEGETFYGHVQGAALRGVLRHTSDAIPVDPKTGGVLWDEYPWAVATAQPVTCP